MPDQHLGHKIREQVENAHGIPIYDQIALDLKYKRKNILNIQILHKRRFCSNPKKILANPNPREIQRIPSKTQDQTEKLFKIADGEIAFGEKVENITNGRKYPGKHKISSK